MVDHRASTTIVFSSEKKKFLIVKRAETKKSNPGKWEFPGGGVEEGETPQEAGLRELKEETGLKGKILKSGEPGKVEVDIWELKVYPFLVEVPDEDVELSKEHTDYRWVKRKDLKKFDTVNGLKKELSAVGLEPE